MEFIEILIDDEVRTKRGESNFELAKNYEKKGEFFNAFLCYKSLLKTSSFKTDVSYKIGKVCQKIGEMSSKDIFSSFNFSKIKDATEIDRNLFLYKGFGDDVLSNHILKIVDSLVVYSKRNYLEHYITAASNGHLLSIKTFNKVNPDKKISLFGEFSSPETQIEMANLSLLEDRFFDAIYWYKNFIKNPKSPQHLVAEAKLNLKDCFFYAESKSKEEINEFYDEYYELLKDREDAHSAKEKTEILLQKLEILVRKTKPKNVVETPSFEDLGPLSEIYL